MIPVLNNDLFQGNALKEYGISERERKRAESPEKVLQFGTGVLLRGLPDYFIDKANKKGKFNGRILVVKSTGNGNTDEFKRQDGLYTLYIKGIAEGKEIQETIIISAIGRVLAAATQWEELLDSATNPDLTIVISNTTEVGIVLDEYDNLSASPPSSFPAKLTALLYKRFQHFDGDMDKGWVVLPTELISDNGTKLQSIVMQLARMHGLEERFIKWLEEANDFCNTLVDRIVPGKLTEAAMERAEAELGYRDGLAVMAEPFRLWAIESDSDRVREKLSFSEVDDGMVIVPDIGKFKELKLRLLNGSHTFACGLALLCGFNTVKAAMQHAGFAHYVQLLMHQEIVETLIGEEIVSEEAHRYANKILDRFANPFLDHEWQSITMNYTSKMRMRNVASLDSFIRKHQHVPRLMALGFAAYLCFMDGTHQVADEHAPFFLEIWAKGQFDEVVVGALGNVSIWGMDLNALPGFTEEVTFFLAQLKKRRALEVMAALCEGYDLKMEK